MRSGSTPGSTRYQVIWLPGDGHPRYQGWVMLILPTRDGYLQDQVITTGPLESTRGGIL